jgi:hypothetical protein
MSLPLRGNTIRKALFVIGMGLMVIGLLFICTPILGPPYSDIEETVFGGVVQVRVRGSIVHLLYGEMAPYLSVMGIILVLFDISMSYVRRKGVS